MTKKNYIKSFVFTGILGTILLITGYGILSTAHWYLSGGAAKDELAYYVDTDILSDDVDMAANQLIDGNDMSFPISYDGWSLAMEQSVKANVCKRLLDVCAQNGILDAKAQKMYHNNMHSINQYKELISECMAEDNFWDTIGETDEWCLYEYYIMSENN